MPKPFPFPLNIGTDICSIPRIRKIFRKPSRGPQFVKRILTERECRENRSRWEAPIERYWQALRRRHVLVWKRDQLGLSKEWVRRQFLDIKEKNGWVGDAEKARNIERDGKVGLLDDEVELELDGGNDLPENEASEDSESSSFANTKVVAEKILSEDAKKGRLSDNEALLLLMERNVKEIREAEVGLNLAAQFIAGRFAAKEAVIKAHHNRRLTYHSIAIHNRSSNLRDSSDSLGGSKAPYAVVISESGRWEDGQEVKLSISHDGDYATAVSLAYEPNTSESTKISTEDGKKPVISQASLSTWEATMMLEDDKHHGDLQVQLIQQEMERRQNFNDIGSSGITQGDTVRRVEDTLESYDTVEKKIPNQIETSRSWTTAQRRASIRSNSAAPDFWNLVSQMNASQKVLFLKKPSHWRPLFVLMIDGLPDGTSNNRLKDLIRNVDERFTYLNVILANDTEGKSLGFAFVRFQTATLAKLALSKASLFVLDGKPLVCRWMGGNRDVGVSKKSAEGSIEASTPQSQIPVEESDSEGTNVDVEVEATDEIDENAGAQPTPVKTLTMAQRRRIKRKREGLKNYAKTMTNRDRAEPLFGLMDGFSEAQLLNCIGTLPYKTRAKFLRLDGLPARTSREELERLLNGNYERTIMRTIRGRGTTIVFVRKQVAREASKRLGPTFTLRGATVTCTWFGARPQEETTRDKDFEMGTIEDAQDSVEKSVEEAVQETTQVDIEDISLQQALDSFYSRGRKPRRGRRVARRIRRVVPVPTRRTRGAVPTPEER